MKIRLSLVVFLLLAVPMFAQQTGPGAPRLIVGVVVDQMRFDYLYKYQDHYGNDGFKRMMREGYNFKNTHYSYIPTYTAPGHASIYTGATPEVHGIVGNSWFDRQSGNVVSNVGDPSVKTTGSVVENPSGYSPSRLLASTITDQLRLGTNMKSKVISVSLKDRGAILPGGRTANAAYWYDWESSPGHFVSSTYYMEELPSWVKKFNAQEQADKYLSETWNPLLPMSEYDESAPDDNPHETILRGKDSPTFPYNFGEMRKLYEGATNFYQVLWGSPFGNTLTKDFALEALRNEGLGKDAYPDMLCVSFSAPDVVGHTFGPQSVEVQDTYIRLDRDIADLLSSLDREVGAGNYLLFLTSDHGAEPVVSWLHANKMQAGLAVLPQFKQDLSFKLGQRFGAFEWITYFGSEQIYLDRKLIADKKFSLDEMQRAVADIMKTQPGYAMRLPPRTFKPIITQRGNWPNCSAASTRIDPGMSCSFTNRGSTQRRTSARLSQRCAGTSHGSGYAYDTQVPMLWFGKGVKRGDSSRKVHPKDIAPTLSFMLNLQMPAGTSGNPLKELLD